MTLDSELDALAGWCVEVFGSAPAETLFEQQHLSRVVGYRLHDGQEVVLKLRPPDERVLACLDVHAYVCSRGFPCPRPLAGPSFLGTMLVTAEAYIEPGNRFDGPEAPRKFAEVLHRLLVLTSGYQPRLPLEPPPPWLGGWSHPGPGIWPPADDLPDDLNAIDTPWLDDVARRVAVVLKASRLPAIAGHADWTATNVEWRNGELHVVHDWDSLAYLPEAAFAGGASVLFSQTSTAAASLDESRAFLEAYEAFRVEPWSAEERSICWAAGLWNLAFDAKKDQMRGGGASLERLQLEHDTRLRLAGV